MTDLARYLIIYKHGGVYADIDVYNYRDIKQLLQPCERFATGDVIPMFVAVTEKPSLQQANYFFAVRLFSFAIDYAQTEVVSDLEALNVALPPICIVSPGTSTPSTNERRPFVGAVPNQHDQRPKTG